MPNGVHLILDKASSCRILTRDCDHFGPTATTEVWSGWFRFCWFQVAFGQIFRHSHNQSLHSPCSQGGHTLSLPRGLGGHRLSPSHYSAILAVKSAGCSPQVGSIGLSASAHKKRRGTKGSDPSRTSVEVNIRSQIQILTNLCKTWTWHFGGTRQNEFAADIPRDPKECHVDNVKRMSGQLSQPRFQRTCSGLRFLASLTPNLVMHLCWFCAC